MNELGFTETYLKQWFGMSLMAEFVIWMKGQTVSIIDGETIFYFVDVANFCNRVGIECPDFSL
jgi:hypothetical protein